MVYYERKYNTWTDAKINCQNYFCSFQKFLQLINIPGAKLWFYRRAICCVTNPGMPWYLQRTLSCSVPLFSFLDYSPGVIKQHQWTWKAPFILEDLNWNGERFLLFFMFHIKCSKTLYFMTWKQIKHSQKQTWSFLWENPTA